MVAMANGPPGGGRIEVDLPRQVFANIFWPAAAGNVFWSFCSLWIDWIDPETPEINFWPRLTLLLIFSIYLTLGWMRFTQDRTILDPKYCTYEFGHLVLLVFCALATQRYQEALGPFLIAYFVWMTLGHWREGWKLSDEKYPRKSLVIVHVIGLLIVLLGVFGVGFFRWFGVDMPRSFFEGSSPWKDWTVPGSFALALLLWAFGPRRKQVMKIFGSFKFAF
jgi:hypothetical protein